MLYNKQDNSNVSSLWFCIGNDLAASRPPVNYTLTLINGAPPRQKVKVGVTPAPDVDISSDHGE